MTRSKTLTQSLAFALFAALLAFAMPVAAWSGNNNDYNDQEDTNDRNPYCSLQASPNTVNGYGAEVNLSWESTDAEWAEISDVGVVPLDSSLEVNVYTSKTYRMTVHNGSRSGECEAFVNILGEVRSNSNNYSNNYDTYYAQQPYVHLTQIPYTGFDFGPMGNAIYWMTLMVLAIGGAYLLVYQKGMRAFASIPVVAETIRAGRMQLHAVRSITNVAVQPVAVSQPIMQETLVETRFGSDSMKVIEGETPRIVITRD